MPSKKNNKFVYLALFTLFISSISNSLIATDKLIIKADSKLQKYCLSDWENQCGHLKKDKRKFIECTKKKTEAGCKRTLTKMIKTEIKEQKRRVENYEQSPEDKKQEFNSCNSQLHKMCPADEFSSEIDQAKCFQSKFKTLNKECQVAIIQYFSTKEPSNKKSNQPVEK